MSYVEWGCRRGEEGGNSRGEVAILATVDASDCHIRVCEAYEEVEVNSMMLNSTECLLQQTRCISMPWGFFHSCGVEVRVGVKLKRAGSGRSEHHHQRKLVDRCLHGPNLCTFAKPHCPDCCP